MNDNKCICCGAIIPEGRHVCLTCERGNDMQTFKGMQPVKRGRWLRDVMHPDKFRCSRCNYFKRYKANFCEYCGADMREGGSNGTS